MCKKRGFTLLELIIVVAVIGTLAAVVAVSLNESRAKARNVKRVTDLREMQTAFESYASDHEGKYPYIPGYISIGGEPCRSTAGCWTTIGNNISAYLPVMPQPPKSTIKNIKGCTLPSGLNPTELGYLMRENAPVEYRLAISADGFKLYASLERINGDCPKESLYDNGVYANVFEVFTKNYAGAGMGI